MSRPRLTAPRYRVLVGDPADEGTWSELEVQCITPDLLRAEEHLVRAKASPATSSIRFGVLAAWAALMRTAQLPAGTTFEAFAASCIDVADAGQEPVRPTDPGPGTG